MLALSIRQPWAWLIVHGWKDIENRTWRTRVRGRFLIHAAKGMTNREYLDAIEFAHDKLATHLGDHRGREAEGESGAVARAAVSAGARHTASAAATLAPAMPAPITTASKPRSRAVTSTSRRDASGLRFHGSERLCPTSK